MNNIETPYSNFHFQDFNPLIEVVGPVRAGIDGVVQLNPRRITQGKDGGSVEKGTHHRVYQYTPETGAAYRHLGELEGRIQAFGLLLTLPLRVIAKVAESLLKTVTLHALWTRTDEPLQNRFSVLAQDCANIPFTLIAAPFLSLAILYTLLAATRGRIFYAAISRLALGTEDHCVTPPAFKAYKID